MSLEFAIEYPCALRARYKEGADLIKDTATGGVLSQARNGQDAQFTDDELRAVVATSSGLPLAVR